MLHHVISSKTALDPQVMPVVSSRPVPLRQDAATSSAASCAARCATAAPSWTPRRASSASWCHPQSPAPQEAFHGGVPEMVGWMVSSGKSQAKMDDGGYSWMRKLPILSRMWVTTAGPKVPTVVQSLSPGFPDLTTAAGERVQGILQDEEVRSHVGTWRHGDISQWRKVENTMPRDTLLNSADMHQHVSPYMYTSMIIYCNYTHFPQLFDIFNYIFQGSESCA